MRHDGRISAIMYIVSQNVFGNDVAVVTWILFSLILIHTENLFKELFVGAAGSRINCCWVLIVPFCDISHPVRLQSSSLNCCLTWSRNCVSLYLH